MKKKIPDKSWKGIIISQGRFFAATNVLAWISPVLIRFSWKRNVYVKNVSNLSHSTTQTTQTVVFC